MRIFTYCFYFISQSLDKRNPNGDSFGAAISSIYWSISYVIFGVILFLIFDNDIQDVFEQHWPYDYGRLHSKNLIAPGVVIMAFIVFMTRFIVRRLFLREDFQKKIESYYGKQSLDLKEHIIVPQLDLALFMIFSSLIIFKIWLGVLICILIFCIQELWIRYRFGWEWRR
ncbi:hypothetical protein [Vibrio coralliilyticus]|uniref:hypothetical protein n=1 Tax=Vibrio coralliilyticus TaxID=190893 RepID=UPI0006CCCF81|nr:hypothetical protein [Vibrio coralliilyticus]AXN30734.1 hypothetical protein DVV14_05160 [Vibrio coralliilyticus]KPH27117.1 hypothetical protein ADU60_02315 [Vibrio coralliilyticus]